MIFKYPTVLYPTLKNSIILGPIRCEAIDGSELYLPAATGRITIFPFDVNGKVFSVTHLQKKSFHFRLRFDPFIYHWGEFSKLQEYDVRRQMWLPGTEKGIYWRTPGWRFDFPGTNGKHWIFSRGFLGGRLD